MSALQCLACEHENPRAAKFCLECGSALNVKLCTQCEAINAVGAERCHKCQAAFTVAVEKVDAAPAKQGLRPIATSALVGLVALLAAAGYYLTHRPPAATEARAAPVDRKPIAVTPGLAPAPIENVAAPLPSPPVGRKPERKALAENKPVAPRPVTHTAVTHTRPAAASPVAPSPLAPRIVAVEKAAIEPPPATQRGAYAPPAVTHTRRTLDKAAERPLMTTEAKREGN